MTYRYKDTSISEQTLRSVWNKGQIVATHDPTIYRQDICGNWIRFDRHGQTIQYGWEIDHINPVANGGGDELSNLQPLEWETNRRKGDTYPWNC